MTDEFGTNAVMDKSVQLIKLTYSCEEYPSSPNLGGSLAPTNWYISMFSSVIYGNILGILLRAGQPQHSNTQIDTHGDGEGASNIINLVKQPQ